MKKMRTRVAFAGVALAGAVTLSIMFAGSGGARLATTAPGVGCQSDGKISGRGSTFQARAQAAWNTGFTADVCGNVADPTPPTGEDIPPTTATSNMAQYNDYEPTGTPSPLTGSGFGLKAMACRAEPFAGTDVPYTTNQLQQLNAQLPTATAGQAIGTNLTNQYILGVSGTAPNQTDNTCQTAQATDFGTDYYPPFQPQDGASPALSSYPNTTTGAADQVAPMMSFPIGGSAVTVVANLTGGAVGSTATCQNATSTAPTSLSLTGIQLSELFGGDIPTWNDSRLTSNNPLLSTDNCVGAVTRVVRLDNSGTTQIFKTYLNHVDPTRTGGTGETCDVGTGADTNSTWTELVGQSPNTNWPGFTPGGTLGTGCTAVVQGDVNGNNGVLDECEGNTAGGNTITGVVGAICYADLPDQHHFGDASPNGGGHGGAPGCSPCTGIVATVQNATLTAFVAPSKVSTANCNYGTVSTPSGADGGIGMTVGPAFAPTSPPPTGWDTWASDNPTSNHGDVTNTGTVYPICGLTWDMVWSGLNNSAANSSAINGLTVDQRRTLYAYFSYVLSSAGQNLLTTNFYQSLPQSVLQGIRSEFQSKF